MASSKANTAVFAVTAIVATPIARKLTTVVWTAATGKASPESVDDPDERLGEAVAFAVLAGATAGLIRMLLNRNARKLLGA